MSPITQSSRSHPEQVADDRLRSPRRSGAPGSFVELELRASTGRDALLAASVAAIALAGRLVDLGRAPLWRDEAVTYWIARLVTWPELLTGQLAGDVHPPLHHVLVKLMLAWSDSEFALRLPFALASAAASVPLFYAARELAGPHAGRAADLRAGRTAGLGAGRTAGTLAGLAFAFSAEHIRYAQEARPYALLVLAASLALFGFVRVGVRQAAERMRSNWLPWASIALALVLFEWSHGAGALCFVTVGCVGLALWPLPTSSVAARPWLRLAGVTGLALLCWSPQYVALAENLQRVNAVFWMRPPAFADLGPAWAQLATLRSPHVALLVGVTTCIAIGLYGIARRHGARLAFALAATVVVPPLTLVVVSFVFRPVYGLRGFLHANLATFALLGCVIARVEARRRWLGLALGGVWLLLGVGDLLAARAEPSTKGPWRDVAAVLKPEATGDDVLLVAPPFVALPLGYQVGIGADQPRIYPICPRGAPSVMALAGELLPLFARGATADEACSTARAVWVVRYPAATAEEAEELTRLIGERQRVRRCAFEPDGLELERYE